MAKKGTIHITNPHAIQLVQEKAKAENRPLANCAANAIINYYGLLKPQHEQSTDENTHSQ